MTGVLHTPPGRAGRLWLRRRLAVADRGQDLLGRKLRVLRHERERLHLHALRAREDWASRHREADTWLLRLALCGGERAIRLAEPTDDAVVDIRYATTMGVTYPAEATCTPAEPTQAALDGSAAGLARDAFQAALAAAARHAAASAALRVMDGEITTTRQRLRALEDRWIPRLRSALAQVELSLEELEHADGVRIRQVVRRQERDEREQR